MPVQRTLNKYKKIRYQRDVSIKEKRGKTEAVFLHDYF